MPSESRSYIPVAQRNDWTTPSALFDALDNEFGPFDLDPAAQDGQYTAETIWQRGGEYMIPPPLDPWGGPSGVYGPASITATDKHARVFFDGLIMSWKGRVFLNPPYGRGVEKWVEKAVTEVECGNAELVCALVKATTDVRWWGRFALTEVDGGRIASHPLLTLVRFLPGRVKFSGSGPAPFPSAVVVWERGTRPAGLKGDEAAK